MSRLSGLVLVVAGSLFACGVGVSEAGEARTHDGFFLRLSAGGGGASTKQDRGSEELEFSGAAGSVNLAVGGMVASNLALHGSIFGWSATDPTIEIVDVASAEFPGDLTVSVIGGGFTYYFMPANIYLSGSAGVATMTLDISGGPEAESDAGFGGDVTLGKEWWVGNSWGLGVAVGVGFHSIPAEPENLSGADVSIRFTATLN